MTTTPSTAPAWSEPVRVNDVEPAAHWGCCTFEPRMAVAPSGNFGLKGPLGMASTDDAVFIAWDDTRNSVGDTQAQDIYLGRVRFRSGDRVFATTAGSSSDHPALWALLGAGIALGVAGTVLLVAQRARGGGGSVSP